jgi:DNA ligase-1
MDPLDVLDRVASTSSTLSKEEILRTNTDPTLLKCLKWMLDPYVTYGVKNVTFAPYEKVEKDIPYAEMFVLLEKLARRELTGNNARIAIVTLSSIMDERGQRLFLKILSKDPACGISDGIVNRAYPKLIPTFEVQLAAPMKKKDKIYYPCLAQPKYDGVRVIALVDPTVPNIRYFSRNGKEFTNFGCFDNDLLKMANGMELMFDGEVVGPHGDQFRSIMQQCRRKNDVDPEGLTYQVFDYMSIRYFTSRYCNMQQSARTTVLVDFSRHVPLSRVSVIDGKLCRDERELFNYFEECINSGYEGLVVKSLCGLYEFKRTTAWIKIKPSKTEDLKIVEIQEGRGKYQGRIGAIIVEREGVRIGVGSGLSDADRVTLDEAQILVGKTAEICFDSVTPDGSFRFPRLVKIRSDK